MNVKPVKNPVTATIEGFVAMTHSSSVHQVVDSTKQVNQKQLLGKVSGNLSTSFSSRREEQEEWAGAV